MTEPAIELRYVSKRYRKITERSLLGRLSPFKRTSKEDFWALREVDFSVGVGEAVAVIGRNGAGKSTLLRLLAGVSQPSSGVVTIRGRVAPLLSVGVGFHQEMTGRENIYVNGMILGLTRAQISSRFDEIVAFAELAAFIDTPVKFYSTGMFMRLGFAVAVHVEPDILIVDEVLAVGDNAFQLRSLNKIREMASQGTTIIFVSHSMHAVHLLCPRTIYLQQGVVQFDGKTEEAIATYHRRVRIEEAAIRAPVEFLHRTFTLPDGGEVRHVYPGQELLFSLVVCFKEAVEGPGIWFRVMSADGTLAYGMQTPIGDGWRTYAAGDEAMVEVRFYARFGGGGSFQVSIDVTDDAGAVVATDLNAVSFYVPPVLGASGPADLSASIQVDGVERTNHSWTRLGEMPLPEFGS